MVSEARLTDRCHVGLWLTVHRGPVLGPALLPCVRPCFLAYRRRTRLLHGATRTLMDSHGGSEPPNGLFCSSMCVFEEELLSECCCGGFLPPPLVSGVERAACLAWDCSAVRSLLQPQQHRSSIAASLTAVLSFFALSWESHNWRLLLQTGEARDGLTSHTLYDLYSLRVCIYKYICVFIFSVEHTHERAHVSDMPVCSGPNTRQLWFAVHWR